MTSTDNSTAHAASAPVDAANARPSDSAKAAVEGTPLPTGSSDKDLQFMMLLVLILYLPVRVTREARGSS